MAGVCLPTALPRRLLLGPLRKATAPEVPELRFTCANSLKQLRRFGEAMAQVLKLLESQPASAQTNPENWIYWQGRPWAGSLRQAQGGRGYFASLIPGQGVILFSAGTILRRSSRKSISPVSR